jgi:hypothetical protein
MHATLTTPGNDTVEEKASTNSYRFKSEANVAVGSCMLQAVHGEIDTVNDAARTHTFQIYFPELRISATASDAEPIVDGLSTDFSEIKPVASSAATR